VPCASGLFSARSGDPAALGYAFAQLMAYDDPQAHYVETCDSTGHMWTVFVGSDKVCRAVLWNDHDMAFKSSTPDIPFHVVEQPMVCFSQAILWVGCAVLRLVHWARGGRTGQSPTWRVARWDDSDGDDATHGEQTACPLCRAPASEAAFVGATAAEREDNECVVCLAAPAALKLPVCGHTCLCADCAKHWTSSA